MKLLRDKQVADKIGCHWSYVWKLARREDFPKPVKLGPRFTAWVDDEIDKWMLTYQQEGDAQHETAGSTG